VAFIAEARRQGDRLAPEERQDVGLHAAVGRDVDLVLERGHDGRRIRLALQRGRIDREAAIRELAGGPVLRRGGESQHREDADRCHGPLEPR
jgi:hypothetical protein